MDKLEAFGCIPNDNMDIGRQIRGPWKIFFFEG